MILWRSISINVDGRAALVVEVVVFDVATEEEEDGMLVVFGFVVPAEEELVRRRRTQKEDQSIFRLELIVLRIISQQVIQILVSVVSCLYNLANEPTLHPAVQRRGGRGRVTTAQLCCALVDLFDQ